MNSKKYKDTLYQMRYINDLRDMVNSSAEMFGDKPAFKEKEDPKGEFKSISFNQLKDDIDYLGEGPYKTNELSEAGGDAEQNNDRNPLADVELWFFGRLFSGAATAVLPALTGSILSVVGCIVIGRHGHPSFWCKISVSIYYICSGT